MRHSPGRAFLLPAFRSFVTAGTLAVLSPGSSAQSMRCESPDGSYRERRIGASGSFAKRARRRAC